MKTQAVGDLSVFGIDPLWLVIVKVLAIFVILVLLTLAAIFLERRIVSWMQMRIGPNRVGPQGTLQSLMDGVKLALKEEIIPRTADRAAAAGAGRPVLRPAGPACLPTPPCLIAVPASTPWPSSRWSSAASCGG